MCVEKQYTSKKAEKNQDLGHCICNRVYGFYGPECRHLSFASYVWIILTVLIVILSIATLIYNVIVLGMLYYEKRATSNNVRSLGFNSLSAVFIICGVSTTVMMATEVDRDMETDAAQNYFMTGVLTFSFLSSMGISIYWIEMVEKVVNRSNRPFNYKVILFGVALIYIALNLFFLAVVSNTPAVGAIGTLIVGYSYNYGGSKVVKILRASSSEYGEGSLKQQHVLELASAIDETSKAMTKYTIVMAFALLGAFLTTCTPSPVYPQQNKLPRWLQSQFFRFLVAIYLCVFCFSSLKLMHSIAYVCASLSLSLSV